MYACSSSSSCSTYRAVGSVRAGGRAGVRLSFFLSFCSELAGGRAGERARSGEAGQSEAALSLGGVGRDAGWALRK